MFLCRFQRQVLGGILSKTIAKPFANNIEQCLMKGGGVGRAAQKCSNKPIHQKWHPGSQKWHKDADRES